MTRTYELPHFSLSLLVSQAEMVEGCGGAPTVGVAVAGCSVAVGLGVGAAVWAVVGVAVGVGVPGAAVAAGVVVPGVVVAVVETEGVGDGETLAEGETLAVGDGERDAMITVPGVTPGVGLLAAAFVGAPPLSFPRVRKTAAARKMRTAATPTPNNATFRGTPGSPGAGGRSASTPAVLER